MKPMRVLYNSKRSIPGSYSKLGIALLCGGALFVFGCTWLPATSPTVQPVAEPVVTGDVFVTLETDAIVVHGFATSETARIPATAPRTAAWSRDNTQLAWVEDTKDGDRITVYNTTTATQQSVYWSAHAVQDITFSPNGLYIAFVEGQALYIMTVAGDDVHRIAEHVLEYTWSLDNRTMAVSTENVTELEQLDSAMHVSAQTVIRADQPMRGIAFRNNSTVLGFVVNTGLEFISYNTISHNTTALATWTATADDSVLPIRIRTEVSPDTSRAMIEETAIADTHRVTQFIFNTGGRVAIPQETRMAGWYDEQIPLLLQGFHLVAKESILGDETIRSQTSITPPVFVRSFTSL